jgi:hypothetical protein
MTPGFQPTPASTRRSFSSGAESADLGEGDIQTLGANAGCFVQHRIEIILPRAKPPNFASAACWRSSRAMVKSRVSLPLPDPSVVSTDDVFEQTKTARERQHGASSTDDLLDDLQSANNVLGPVRLDQARVAIGLRQVNLI